jgi:dipeptidyl-peptidase III
MGKLAAVHQSSQRSTKLCEAILIPLVQTLSNLVNYRSFGFTKIVPRIPEDKFEAVVRQSRDAVNVLPLWNEVSQWQHRNFHVCNLFVYV